MSSTDILNPSTLQQNEESKDLFQPKSLKNYQDIATTSNDQLPIQKTSQPVELIVASATTSGTPDDPFHCHNEEIAALQNSPKTRRAIQILWLTVFVCLAFMICEVIGGWLAQSLAIITDAAHLV